MRRSTFAALAALAVTGALALGPAAAQATPVTPYHAGHDHGTKPEKPKPKPKPKKSKHDHDKGHHHGDHGSGHHNGQQGNGAHASGGYDSHRSHPR